MEPEEREPDEAATRRRFHVHGRVQGVGFRAWTSDQARRLALRGIVRNRPDGVVEVEAAGPPPALEALRELLRRGPLFASVEEVRELPATPAPLPDDFRITR